MKQRGEAVVPVVLVAGMAVATVVVLGAVFTGNGQALCDRLQGKYVNGNCVGGSWGNVFSALPKPEPKPEAK